MAVSLEVTDARRAAIVKIAAYYGGQVQCSIGMLATICRKYLESLAHQN